MTTAEFRENSATLLGRRVVAALDARDFDAFAELFAPDYVEVIQRPGNTPIPRDDMLGGIRALVEGAGGALTIEPIATVGDRLQLHHTRITVPTPDGEPTIVDYMSVLQVGGDGRARRTEAFDRLEDARGASRSWAPRSERRDRSAAAPSVRSRRPSRGSCRRRRGRRCR